MTAAVRTVIIPNPGRPHFIKYLPVPGHPNGDLNRITVGSDGALWFTGTTAIGRIDLKGNVKMFPLPSSAGEPIAITSGADGNIWFSFYGPPHGIGRLTTNGKMTMFPFKTPGEHILYMTAGPDKNVWFTEWEANAVGWITPAGHVTEYQLKEWGAPNGITFGPDGMLWVSEQGALVGSKMTPGRILRMTVRGAILGSFPLSPRSWTTAPVEIANGADGNVWFTEADYTNHPRNIERITTRGQITKFWLGPKGGFEGLALGADGNLWITEVEKKIARITPAGEITEFFIPEPPGSNEAQPRGIVSGPLNDLWFVESTAGSIGQFSPL